MNDLLRQAVEQAEQILGSPLPSAIQYREVLKRLLHAVEDNERDRPSIQQNTPNRQDAE